MDSIADPLVSEVVVIKSAQVGWTEILNNAVGYYVSQDPAPILVVQPSVEMAEAWSKDRLAPMLRDSPSLRNAVSDAKSRTSGNTLLHKTFPGGHLTVSGANSAASLASRPIRIVLFDEVDRYPASAGTEGDPVTLGKKRSTTFWNRKTLLGSTPTIAGKSRIEAAYETSDKRRYWVPCPHCDEFQVLKWSAVKWDGNDPATALMHCVGCGVGWTDAERYAAVRKGEWRAEEEFRGIAGFHISELYSPWVKLSETVLAFLAAKGKPEMLKARRDLAGARRGPRLGAPGRASGRLPDGGSAVCGRSSDRWR
jgi:phage terminase large subunit GpA-like protein